MSKLVIISHTKHYYSQNRQIVGWEPTIREINYLSKIFDSIYHVAPLYSGNAHQANASYNKNITYFPIKPAGGDGILKKMEIIFTRNTSESDEDKTIEYDYEDLEE